MLNPVKVASMIIISQRYSVEPASLESFQDTGWHATLIQYLEHVCVKTTYRYEVAINSSEVTYSLCAFL